MFSPFGTTERVGDGQVAGEAKVATVVGVVFLCGFASLMPDQSPLWSLVNYWYGGLVMYCEWQYDI